MFEICNLDKSFGVVYVMCDVLLKLECGECWVILGLNGVGKMMFFNQFVGELILDSGLVYFVGEDVIVFFVVKCVCCGFLWSYQKNMLFDGLMVEENFGFVVVVYIGNVMQFWLDSLVKFEVCEIVEEVVSQVNLMFFIYVKVFEISYGVCCQFEVGVVLVMWLLVLLMDELISGVGLEMLKGFYDLLVGLFCDLIMLIIEYDMDFVFDVVNMIMVLNYGEVVFDGLFEEVCGLSLFKEIYLGSWEDV